jgi:hypothetical protein
MIFRTIATFEKLDSNILDVMSKNIFYVQLLECYLFDGNPYSISSNKLSEDNSYIEIYVEYHSEQFYRMWYDEFKDKYVSLIRLVLEEFKNLDINVDQYFDNIDLPGLPEERKSIESFVSRFK